MEIVDLGGAAALIDGARERVSPSRAALVAITGIDGCGKGYIAERLRCELEARGRRVAPVGIDGWLNLPTVRFGGPDPAAHFYRHALRFDEMFSRLVLPLRDRRSVTIEMDFAEETAAGFRKQLCAFHDIDVILLEGIYLLKREYRKHYDGSIWIDCPFETALERAVARAQEGLPPGQTVAAYRSIYFPAQEIHFREDDPVNAATAVLPNP